MKKNVLIYISLMLLFLSCEKKENKEPRGEAILSSRLFGSGPYYTNGFSFSKGDEVKYPGGDVKPDLILLSKINNLGEINGAYLESPDNPGAFSLAGEYDNSSRAESFYEGYTEVNVSEYIDITDNVKPNQVWIIKTRSGNYAKILTTALAYFEEGVLGSHAELSIRWEYQPSDSKIFTTK